MNESEERELEVKIGKARYAAIIQQDLLIDLLFIASRAKLFHTYVSKSVESYAYEHKDEKDLGAFYNCVKRSADTFSEEYTSRAVKIFRRYTGYAEEEWTRSAIFTNPAQNIFNEI